jgi:hypothetical protein
LYDFSQGTVQVEQNDSLGTSKLQEPDSQVVLPELFTLVVLEAVKSHVIAPFRPPASISAMPATVSSDPILKPYWPFSAFFTVTVFFSSPALTWPR